MRVEDIHIPEFIIKKMINDANIEFFYQFRNGWKTFLCFKANKIIFISNSYKLFDYKMSFYSVKVVDITG